MKKKEIYQDFYRDMNVIIGYNLFDEYFFFSNTGYFEIYNNF